MQREHHPKNLKTVPAGNQNSLIKKASAQNRAKALKIMRFLGLVANQGGLLPLAPENCNLNSFVWVFLLNIIGSVQIIRKIRTTKIFVVTVLSANITIIAKNYLFSIV